VLECARAADHGNPNASGSDRMSFPIDHSSEDGGGGRHGEFDLSSWCDFQKAGKCAVWAPRVEQLRTHSHGEGEMASVSLRAWPVTFYAQERRCLAAAEAWRPERLLPRFEGLFATVICSHSRGDPVH
jgi:hypothetical protein